MHKESLEKEIVDLKEKRHLLLQQVMELDAKQKSLVVQTENAQKRLDAMEADIESRLKECGDKVADILAAADAKESVFTSKLQDLEKQDAAIAQKEVALRDLEKSLEVRRVEMEAKEKAFSEREANFAVEAEKVSADLVATQDEAGRIVGLNAKNDEQLRILAAKDADQNLREEALCGADALLNQKHLAISQKEKEVAETLSSATVLKEEAACLFSAAESKQNILTEKEGALNAREKALVEKEASLDLRSRKTAALEKKVQEIIAVNKLEQEVEKYVSNG